MESEWGEPGSPALCFWHDLDGLGAAALGEVARVLARDYGFYVVASRCPSGEPASVEAGLGLLDALGLEETVVMGHASGAALACHAAAAARERVVALVLLEGGHVDEGGLRPSEAYPDIKQAGIRILLLTATEPPISPPATSRGSRASGRRCRTRTSSGCRAGATISSWTAARFSRT